MKIITSSFLRKLLYKVRNIEYQNIVLTKDFEIYIIELEKYRDSKMKSQIVE